MRNFTAALALAAIAIALTGCVTQPQRKSITTAEAAAYAVTVERDDFKKVTWYNGADIFDQAYDTVFLRAWKNDGAPSRYQIYVADYYGGEWRFYESAYDSNGTRIDTTLIDRKVISCGSYTGCTYAEHMGLNVTRDYLERHAATGMTFQISGRAGKEIFYIPDFHIQGFLASTPK